MRRAVIDVGSNSVLLLVAEKSAENWIPVFEATEVTALGEGTKSTGLISEASASRTLSALKRMFDLAGSHGASTIKAAGTMALRIATNTPDFLKRCQEQGTPVTVFSGDEEAALGFDAVANDPQFAQWNRLSIIDPGGQSTELVTADRSSTGWEVRFRKSFGVGTLGLKGEVLKSESPDHREIIEATVCIDETLGFCYLPGAAGVAIVLGATGTNLVSIRERLSKWDPKRVHGAKLEYEEISRAVGSMMPLTDEERREIPGMEPGRERTIHIGALILERFLDAIGATSCFVSVRGWRHAMLERM